MSLRLLRRDHPSRAFAIVTDEYALVFRHSQGGSSNTPKSNATNSKSSPTKGMIEFSALTDVDLSDYRLIKTSGIHGTLGLININNDVFLCLITAAVRVASLRPWETVLKILSVEFHCMNRSDYDFEFNDEFDPYSEAPTPGGSYESGHEPYPGGAPTFEHPCLELKKMLGGGTFYFSVDCDLTNRLQDRTSHDSVFDIDGLDEAFLWNSYMISPLVKFRSRLSAHEKTLLDTSKILTLAIRGFVSTITIPPSASPVKVNATNLPSSLTVLSRLSCRRAGTRFNSRGIDDDGNVANFVETETLLWHPSGLCFSYAQTRGSVPIFWEQAPGLLPGQQKIQLTRSLEASQPAFDKHFEGLEIDYGTVHILNLLSETRPGEAELTARYRYHVQRSPLNQTMDVIGEAENRLLETQFDFHAESKGPGSYEAANMVKRLVSSLVDGFAYFLCEEKSVPDATKSHTTTTVKLQQEGIFRTNCLDCLDRTNLVQNILSQMALECFLGHRGDRATSDFWVRHSSLWADNGDALSKIYAGTGALKSSFTRHGKVSLAGALADARKSATRIYMNNFADKGRQNTTDMLLGRLIDQSPVELYDPITDHVNAELKKMINDYSKIASLKIRVGTFNLNGKSHGTKQDLTSWLCPRMEEGRADIVAVGFQEIVELSPQQIMSTDPARRLVWEDAVGRMLNDDAKKHSTDQYILLRSGQLVGAALMLFVKSSLLSKIKNVEGSVKKTGMSGVAGNKGAVAIRLEYANTRFCFVTAHMAAGFANFEERNRDYRTISQGLRFQHNRSIEDHDTIIWLGDFNYRIGLGDEKVRQLINIGNLETLYQNDQLNLQMVAGNVFKHYSEARIMFMPTYKYDNGTDHYDSSEKSRIPAWCDRILRKGDLKQISYSTAPLRFSDHRPVYAEFLCTISDIDEAKKESLSREIYIKRKADIGDTTANATNDEIFEDQDLIGYDSIAPELPPASSDRRRWWLDNGLPARSQVKPPDDLSILNSRRPSNPFTPSEEPDWVAVSKTAGYQPQSGPDQNATIRSGTATISNRAQPSYKGSQKELTSAEINQKRVQISIASSSSQLSHQQSIESTALRKSAPPVPQKPLSLSRTGEQDEEKGFQRVQHKGQDMTLLNTNRPSSNSNAAMVGPPQQTSGNASPLRDQKSTKLWSSEESGPPLPPRRNGQSQSPLGLMDDDVGGACEIPSLQPQQQTYR